MEMRVGKVLVGLLLALCLCATAAEAQLRIGFYNRVCPQVEYIVFDEVAKAVKRNMGLAAGLVRMHFHDCFVRGCDASILIDSTPGNVAEKDAPPNNPSLRGLEIIDTAKARLEALPQCKGKVSCADIIAFAARDAVVLSVGHGFRYYIPAGRRDGLISRAADTVDLPNPSSDLSQLTLSFARKGLTQDDLITLSGAHSIGRSHCTSFTDRLYNFNSTFGQDLSLDSLYAARLKQQCPRGNNQNLVVPMDPLTPNALNTNYYKNVLAKRGLFTSDQTLMSTRATAATVRLHAFNPSLFERKFKAAMIKMGQIGVLTGTNGEIRSNCRRIN